MLILMCDGSSKGNPGEAAIGVIVWKREAGTSSARSFSPIHRISKSIGIGTNNDAEWQAVIEALRYAKSINYVGEVFIYTDSLLVASQANGEYKIKQENTRRYHSEYCNLCNGLRVKITWIPRQLTYLADRAAG